MDNLKEQSSAQYKNNIAKRFTAAVNNNRHFVGLNNFDKANIFLDMIAVFVPEQHLKGEQYMSTYYDGIFMAPLGTTSEARKSEMLRQVRSWLD